MAYQGKYQPGPKYVGDRNNCFYCSLWERQLMKWADNNEGVVAYSANDVVIPYRCVTDNRIHHYYIDFMIEFKNGGKYLIEIKPAAQTKPPEKRKMTRRYLNEVLTYSKNMSKWTYAKDWAEARGFKFQIWTENTLKKLGIKILS